MYQLKSDTEKYLENVSKFHVERKWLSQNVSTVTHAF